MEKCTGTQFADEAEVVFQTHGIYLWGGNGELTESLTIKKIRQKEQSLHDAARVLSFIAEQYDTGRDMTASRAVDCSGLEIYILRKLKCIDASADYRARDLQAKSKVIILDNLKAGDQVYNKKTGATHMGTYVGNGFVIEAAGRDQGVIKRKLSAGKWVIGGRLPYIKEE